MPNKTTLKIVVADSSVIVRSGLVVVLKRLPNFTVHPIEVEQSDQLTNCVLMHKPDIVIVSPNFGGWFDVASFKTEMKRSYGKCVALVSTVLDSNILKEYHESISICDDVDSINSKISTLMRTDKDTEEKNGDDTESLSQREKEIIINVVKGLTNKEIAEKLFLSPHTVITHRRNIARKLQIHSSSGLTIYAIVNKLVELEDVALGE